MPERTYAAKPSIPRLASRRLLQQFGVHPRDREAIALDMSGTTALCIGTNHSVTSSNSVRHRADRSAKRDRVTAKLR